MSSSVAAILAQAFNLVKSEEEKVLLPALATCIANVAANPTLINLAAQGTLLLNEAIAAQGKIGQDALQAISNAVSNAAVAAVPAAPTPSAAPPAAPSVKS